MIHMIIYWYMYITVYIHVFYAIWDFLHNAYNTSVSATYRRNIDFRALGASFSKTL